MLDHSGQSATHLAIRRAVTRRQTTCMNPMDRTSLIKEHLLLARRRIPAWRNASRPPDCVEVSSGRIIADFEPGRVFAGACEPFRQFLGEFLGRDEHAQGTQWRFSLDAAQTRPGFIAGVSRGEVRVSAATERDLTDAMHYLEREMTDRGGPWLPAGTIERHPTLATRFTESIFIPGDQSPENPGDFPPPYLELMRHFGGNALKMNLSLADCWRSESLPELNTPDVDRQFEKLSDLARRLAWHGMDFFLMLNAKAHPSTHAVFRNHPEVLGAREEIFIEELSGADCRVLCTSHPLVLRAYGEVLVELFTRVPELAGGIMIVGGEGFHHCFMRPADVTVAGTTNCPHCGGRNPHEHVAALVNSIAAALRAAAPEKRLIVWPYSAFIWSKDDPTDSEWIRHLDSKVEIMSNFDCGDVDPTTGAGVVLYDYNIKITGPSTRFAAQSRACHEHNLPLLAKTETNTTPDTFFLPYLPTHFRWYERFRAIREAGCSGFMGQWRFYGMNGSPPEELQYHSVWNPERSAEELLHTIARRDFGFDAGRADQTVAAWRHLSEAWEVFPYSAMTAGEREGYMRGPWYLGPAHPLIFNSQSTYDLGPAFFLLRGDLAEMVDAEERARLPRKPRYVCDLLLCLPFGVAEYLRLARLCRDQWDEGLRELETVLADNPAPPAAGELQVCRAISIHLHSLTNTVEFLERRDELGRSRHSPREFETRLAQLDAILDREISNARRALPVLEADPRIGYGHIYGEVYDVAMVRDKIRQCEYVRHKELPRIGSLIRFHLWNIYP